jgi:hypothetical protein
MEPKELEQTNSACSEIAHLANHMLTRIPQLRGEPQTSEQKMVIQTKSAKFEVDIDREFGPNYFDFLEACMDSESGLEQLAKVKPPLSVILIEHY